jgi:5-methyltetrahydrofolate--homocysteine methyltransferase
MGPTGQLCQPFGPLRPHDVAAAFAEQAQALTDGGVDLLVLETFFAIEEAAAAVEGVRGVSGLPLVLTFSFDQGTLTMMGVSPTEVVETFRTQGLAAIGANCGRSLSDTDMVVLEFLDAAGELPLWIKPNAGIPKLAGEAVIYETEPGTLASHARCYADQGVRVVGGCCGSTPDHVAAIARAVRNPLGQRTAAVPSPSRSAPEPPE